MTTLKLSRPEKTLLDQGLHNAVCVCVVVLGTIFNELYGKAKLEIHLGFEVLGQTSTIRRDGHEVEVPKIIGKRYTASLHAKSGFRRDIESWRGRSFTDEELREGFSPRKVLGQPCQIQVIHQQNGSGKTFAKIASILPYPKGETAPSPQSDLILFDIEEHSEIPAQLPRFLADRIRLSEEWQAREAACEGALASDFKEDF